MIRKILFAAAVLAAFGGPATAQVTAALAPVHPKLKAEATVNGDLVRIGDLVANAGIIADVPIFRAPDLGATGMVSAESGGRGRARSRAGRPRYRGLTRSGGDAGQPHDSHRGYRARH